MNTYLPATHFASYDCGAYGADSYNHSAVCGTETAVPANDGLAYTGAPLYTFAAVATLIVAISVVLLLKNRRK